MVERSVVGSRIRERRLLAGVKQSDLAAKAGISASYLNLIEHNRRRIGGRTLLQLAQALDVEPALLSEGAQASLVSALRAAAGAQPVAGAELDRTEEFASRFPGWAGVLSATASKVERLEQSVQALTDRMAHDPQLSTSLHEVISMVTAIRSTASILADPQDIAPEWRARFNRNINEDSQRLAEGAEALVRYLEEAPDLDREIRSPLDEMHAWLEEREYHVPEAEQGDAAIAEVLTRAPLPSQAGQSLTRGWLEQVAEDAAVLPYARMQTALAEIGPHPDRLLPYLDVPGPVLLRRLGQMPQAMTGPIGLAICDPSGSLVFRRPLPGFDLPRAAGGCGLWPLYRVLGLDHPLKAVLTQDSGGQDQVVSYALSETVMEATFDQPALRRGYMLIRPAEGRVGPALQVGSSCRICVHAACPVRREPSILTKGF